MDFVHKIVNGIGTYLSWSLSLLVPCGLWSWSESNSYSLIDDTVFFWRKGDINWHLAFLLSWMYTAILLQLTFRCTLIFHSLLIWFISDWPKTEFLEWIIYFWNTCQEAAAENKTCLWNTSVETLYWSLLLLIAYRIYDLKGWHSASCLILYCP